MIARSLAFMLVAMLLMPGCRGESDSPPPASEAPRGTATVQNAPSPSLSDSTALAFVRTFYGKYAPAASAQGLQATDSVLGASPEMFAPALRAALKNDRAAREAASPGELDGLNFEPILASQDPCERYEAGGVERSAPGSATVNVSVFAVCGGSRSDRPAVVAEVKPNGSSWVFVNFHYVGDGKPSDLLGTLRELHPTK